MLHDGGVIDSIRNRIFGDTIKYKREWYTVDALFVSGKDLHSDGLSFPSEIHAVIEHEQGDDIEIEMWKLTHWRAPLKVIFFYGWNDDDVSKNEIRMRWKEEKINHLMSMLKSVNEFHKESSNTEYLFIIGARRDVRSTPYWECIYFDSDITEQINTIIIGSDGNILSS